MSRTNANLKRSLVVVDQTQVLVPPTPLMSPERMPSPTLAQLDRLHDAIAASGLEQLDVDAHTAHHFCKGLYARELRIPAGYVVVGKMHASENFFLIVSGDVSISTRDGIRRVQGPLLAVTKPGDKRVAFAHTDTIMFNFDTRADEVEDPKLLETRYVVPRDEEHRALEYLFERRLLT